MNCIPPNDGYCKKCMNNDLLGSVLFLLRSEAFVFFIAQWVSSMVRWKIVDDGLFDRIFFSFRRERGWDGPYSMTEGDNQLQKQEKKVELLSKDESEYEFVEIDEAHHVFSDREALEFIKTKGYDKATMVLMSDSSQAHMTGISYPQGLEDVVLSEVVRRENSSSEGMPGTDSV